MEGLTIDDFEVGLLAPALETGTLNRSSAILMQAGFSSRAAALKIIADTNPTFESASELKTWLRSEDIEAMTATDNWPTAETRSLWIQFQNNYAPSYDKVWNKTTIDCPVVWFAGIDKPAPNMPMRVELAAGGHLSLFSPAMEPLGHLDGLFPDISTGVIRGRSLEENENVRVEYFGPVEFTMQVVVE